MPGSKERYLKFCRETYVPLHLQPWWLDAVCGAQAWSAAVVGDPPLAIMPYFRTRRWGLPVVQQPPLTAYAGPWFRYPGKGILSQYKKQAFEQRNLALLIQQLPKLAFFNQTFRPEIQDWLPFYWAGFRQTMRYTYLLPDTSNLPELYKGLKNTVRTDLRRAAETLEIIETNESAHLLRLNMLSYARKGRRQPYSPNTFKRLHQALTKRQLSIGFLAKKRVQGTVCAGLYLVFDDRQAAVLLAGLDTACQDTGVLHCLYWQAVQYCSKKGLSLDFEGSMDPGIERVFRSFGGQLRPYFRLWRVGNTVLDKWYRPRG